MKIDGNNNTLARGNVYNGITLNDAIKMLEERFEHLLKKDDQISAIFEENRKLTDEVIRQNADFRLYNEAYRRQQERINEMTIRIKELTDILLKNNITYE